MAHAPILLIAPTRIGDAVLATALLRHIAATQPGAQVTIATSALAAPLFEGYPLLHALIRMPKKALHLHWLDLLREVGGTRWSTVWDLRGSLTSYLLRTDTRHLFRGSDLPVPRVQQYAYELGLDPLPYPTLWMREANRAQAKAMLPEGSRYLVLAPAAGHASKEWPLHEYTALAQKLLDEGGPCTDWRPVIICAGHERERVLPLVEALARYRPVDLTRGALPLLSVYGCLTRAHGFIGNDAGPMHMAAAAGIPTLGLFGPSNAVTYQPWGHRTAFVAAEGNGMAQLSTETVASAFADLLKRPAN